MHVRKSLHSRPLLLEAWRPAYFAMCDRAEPPQLRPVPPTFDEDERLILLCQLKYRDCDIAPLRELPVAELRAALRRTQRRPEVVQLASRAEFDCIAHQ